MRTQALFGRGAGPQKPPKPQKTPGGGIRQSKQQKQTVDYGTDWYQATREAARPKRTTREELGRRLLRFCGSVTPLQRRGGHMVPQRRGLADI